MDTTALVKADYLDILFEHRNKQYGSYQLRKNYNERTLKSLGIVFTLGSALALYGLLSGHNEPSLIHIAHSVPVSPTNIYPKVFQIEPPKPTAPAASRPTIANAIPKIVDDIKVTTPPPTITDLNTKDPGLTNSTGDPKAGTGNPTIGGTGTIPVVAPPVTTPVTWSEVMPQFNGDMNSYLSKALRYPAQARDMGVDGKVTVQFIVNEDGSVTNAHVLKGIGSGCDEEALRVVNSMPKWKPGMQNGKAVKVYYTLPIRFMLE